MQAQSADYLFKEQNYKKNQQLSITPWSVHRNKGGLASEKSGENVIQLYRRQRSINMMMHDMA